MKWGGISRIYGDDSSREGWLSTSPAEMWFKAEVWCESSNEETGCPPSLTPQWTLQGRQRPGELGGEGPRCPCWWGTGISKEPGARFGVWRLWEKDRGQEICSDLWSKSSNHLIWKQATEYQQVSWVRKEPVFSWMIVALSLITQTVNQTLPFYWLSVSYSSNNIYWEHMISKKLVICWRTKSTKMKSKLKVDWN